MGITMFVVGFIAGLLLGVGMESIITSLTTAYSQSKLYEKVMNEDSKKG
jgi:hypothetical protein